ncbi:hypothetical protein CEXT_334071 [Caerostris extrusa]|uniref:RNase H type-1 domain-containing protein n=1 Tax=Caerostris extrusa TaxID=172846 RepID=A0AAV4XYR2_CAEEX|nr:hypothetical protein CEXT_334071 [Caerostris extrusa]
MVPSHGEISNSREKEKKEESVKDLFPFLVKEITRGQDRGCKGMIQQFHSEFRTLSYLPIGKKYGVAASVGSQIINNISPRALVIYTDGSKSDSGRTGSGIFMKTSTGEFRYRFRNPDHSSVFRSELTAISETLSLVALDFKVPDV